MEQEPLTFPVTGVHPRFFSRLVLLNLKFSVLCFADHCLSVLSFLALRLRDSEYTFQTSLTHFHSRILHESLRWLIANNRTKQARIEVNKIAKINKVKLDDVLPLLESENEMTSLTKSEEAPKEDSKQKRDNLFTVVRHKRLLKISAIMAFTW